MGPRPLNRLRPVALAALLLAAGCEARPPLPVVVTLRDSLVGEGKVAIFSNQTANRLTVTVTAESAAAGQRWERNLDLDPNGTAEVGWMEGWRFESGETVAHSHPTYRTRTYRVP